MGGIIVIEGNIASGKTTLGRSIAAARRDVVFLEEPAEKNPYLSLFYEDPHRWAYTMQSWILKQRHATYKSAADDPSRGKKIYVLDRSVYGDWAFASNGHLSGFMSDAEWEAYLAERGELLRELPRPAAVLYLEVAPGTCHDRMRGRARDCEKEVPLGYLKSLDERYSVLMAEMESNGHRVVRMNWEDFGREGRDKVMDLVASCAPSGGVVE